MESIKILMVDDNPDDLELFGRSLRQIDDIKVVLALAHSGDEAYERLMTNGEFDAILLDHNLPGKNGLEILREWSDLVPHLPAVILLTGHGGERIAVEAIKSGAFDYFSKHDVTPEELVQAVQRAVCVTRLRQNLATERGKRAELEAQLQQALLDPGELSGVRRTVATFLHEINSPLTGISAYIRMLLDKEMNEETRAIYGEVLTACRKIEDVLHSMEELDSIRPRPGTRAGGPIDLRSLL